MNFSDYGTAVNVTAPPADQVASFQSFLKAALSFSASSGSVN
jgi:hypothetical protein